MPTIREIRDYLDEHIASGRGSLKLSLDRRGLQYLRHEHFDKIELKVPVDEHTHDAERVFVRAIF